MLTNSYYLKSAYISKKALRLAEHVISNKKFTSNLDGHAFTRTNVGVYKLLQEIQQNIPLFSDSLIVSLYLETRKKPVYNDLKRRIKSVVGLIVMVSISIFYFVVIASDTATKWEFIASATAGIVSTFIYQWISD
jgi:hypothetical protein